MSACKIASLTLLKDDFVFDKKFNITKYLQNDFAKRFGRAEERLFINGKGGEEPIGVLAKDADVFTASDNITYDDVVNLYLNLDDKYARNAVFVVNRKTALTLRTIKDPSGNPIWNINDNTIFSKRVLISDYMPDIASGNKAVFFGDLSYYWVVITEPLSVNVLTELFAFENAEGYAAHERLDGQLICDDAVSILQIG